VQILEVTGSGAPCAASDLYLQSSALSSAIK
jgi:hypothetical protein